MNPQVIHERLMDPHRAWCKFGQALRFFENGTENAITVDLLAYITAT